MRCECCKEEIQKGSRRNRCTSCKRLVGLCCQGDLEPFLCTDCYQDHGGGGSGRQ